MPLVISAPAFPLGSLQILVKSAKAPNHGMQPTAFGRG
jgi:hypothetical protein